MTQTAPGRYVGEFPADKSGTYHVSMTQQVKGQPPTCATSLAAGKRTGVLRKARGWSQARLGREAGISPGMVSFLEAGERNFTLPVMEKVAKALWLKEQG